MREVPSEERLLVLVFDFLLSSVSQTRRAVSAKKKTMSCHQ